MFCDPSRAVVGDRTAKGSRDPCLSSCDVGLTWSLSVPGLHDAGWVWDGDAEGELWGPDSWTLHLHYYSITSCLVLLNS